MSKYTDDLKTLILEHDRILQGYEGRLDDLGTMTDIADAQILLVRSQLEFFALNIRVMRQGKEQELERAEQMEAYESVPGGMGPIHIPQRAIPFPDPPEGAVSRVVYRKADNPMFILLMHRFADGHLVPAELTETWTPTDKWMLAMEESIIDAEFTGDRPS